MIAPTAPAPDLVPESTERVSKPHALIVESHPILREGIASILAYCGCRASTCSTAKRAVEFLKERRPDVVVLGRTLRDDDGLVVARAASKIHPRLPVVMLCDAVFEEEAYLLLKAGVSQAVPYEAGPDRLYVAVHEAMEGAVRIVPSGTVARPRPKDQPIRDESGRWWASSHLRTVAEHCPLSKKELEIVRLIASGNSNGDIARKLRISDQTIKNHVTHIIARLQVYDRAHAAAYCLERQWIRDVTWREEVG